MKLKRKILAMFIIIVMILPNFLTPFQNVAFATGERSLELVLAANNMTVNNDGSIDAEIYREARPNDTTTIHVEAYNDYGEKFNLVDCTNDPDHKKEEFDNENLEQAYCTISFDDIENCYLKITSDNISDLNMVHFFIGNNDYEIDEQNRFFLNEDVLDDDFVGIAFNSVRDLGAPKRISFEGENLVVNENTLTMDNLLVYSTGTMSFTVYNANGEPAPIEFYSEYNPDYDPDDQTSPMYIPSTTSAFMELDTNTYEGSYMIMSVSDGDLEGVYFNFFGEVIDIDSDTGRVDFRDLEHSDGIDINEWRISNGNREISITANHTSINGNTVIFDSPIEDNSGRISMSFYNSDGTTPVIIKPYTNSNHEPEDTGCTVFLNSKDYDGVYATVNEDSTFNIEDLRFNIDGENYVLEEDGQKKCIYFPEISPDLEHPEIPRNIQLDEYSIRPLLEKKEISINGRNLSCNGNAITMDCPIEDISGTLTLAFYNADNTPAEARLDEYWEGEEQIISTTNGGVRFNTTSYEGTYMVVTSTSDPAVNLIDIMFQIGNESLLVDTQTGRVYFPNSTIENEIICIDEWSIQERFPNKKINVYDEYNMEVVENTITMHCTIPGNEGLLTFTFFNADGTPARVARRLYWNDATSQDEPVLTESEIKFNAKTYAGAYFTVTSTSNPPVDLTDVRFDFAGYEYLMNENHKVTLTDELDDHGINLDEYSIEAVNTRKEVYIENVHYTENDNEPQFLNPDGTVTIDCNIENNEGTLTIGAYNADGTQVPFRYEYGWTDDPYADPPLSVCGVLKTTTFEGAYFTVTSTSNPPVDLTKIEFAFAGLGDEVQVVDGKVYIPEMDRIQVVINDSNIRNKAKNNVTVKATATNGYFSEVTVNNIEYIEYREPGDNYQSIDSVDKTLNIEARTNDEIRINLEYGYVINTLKINNKTIITDGEEYEYSGVFPHVDTYNIEVTCAKDESIIPQLCWSRTDYPYGTNCIVENGTIEVISVTLPDGTTYDADEMMLHDDPGMGWHYRHEREATLYYEYDEDDNLVGGSVGAKKGSTILFRLTPDDGFQVVNSVVCTNDEIEVNITPTEIAGEYTLVVPEDIDQFEDDILFAGIFARAYPDGLNKVDGVWYYYKDNQVQTDFTGLVKKDGTWFYVQNGRINWGVETLVKKDGTWFYVNNSMLDWNFTGLVKKDGTWYYVQKGVLNWGVTTLVKRNGTWFYVNNSMVDWSFTGLVKKDGTWYYIQKGQLNWGVTTLVKKDGTWFYVNNSMVDWSFTGLVKKDGTWYYIQKGQLTWGVETLVKKDGTWFYVNNSMVDWNYTGLVKKDNTWYYVQKGMLKWGYNGTVTYKGKKYTVKNSMVV